MLFTSIDGFCILYTLGVKCIHPANSGPDMLLLLLKALIDSQTRRC